MRWGIETHVFTEVGISMRVILLFLLLPAVLLACAAEEPSEELPAIDGPALVMWYTDN